MVFLALRARNDSLLLYFGAAQRLKVLSLIVKPRHIVPV